MVIRHPNNLGKGAALATAFDAAAGDAKYVITLDGDGQHFPEDIPRFFPHLSPDTILIGRREEVSGSMPRSSLFGREFSDFWIGVETGVIVHDTQSGFRAYPLRHVRELKINSHHYNFEMEIITRALWAGLKVTSVPIRVWYPAASERVSSFHPLRDNARFRSCMRNWFSGNCCPSHTSLSSRRITARKSPGCGESVRRWDWPP